MEYRGRVRCAHRLSTLGLGCDSTTPSVFASPVCWIVSVIVLGICNFIITAGGGFSLTAETHVEQEEGQNECEERGLTRSHLTVTVNASEGTLHEVHRPSSDSACMVVSAARGEHTHAHMIHFLLNDLD